MEPPEQRERLILVRLRNVTWVVATAVLVAGIAAPAFAQTEDDESPAETPATYTMDVQVGIQGYAHPDEPLPVVVDLTSEELLVGRIDVSSGGTTIRTDIEVPANSAKQYVLYGAAPADRRQVTVRLVRLVDGDEVELDRQSLRIVPPAEEVLVGVLGVEGITTALRSAASTPLARDIVPLSVSAGSLSRGGGPLAYLVVDSGEVADMDDAAVSSLLAWVRAGGRLVGQPVALERFTTIGTGAVLDRTPAAVTRFGEGELIAVTDPASLGVDDWSGIVRDVPPIGLIRTDSGFVTSADSLVAAATAGREAAVPALPWLLGGIALFIVLVGPVNFLVLRRAGRPEWAWATVPVLSLLFVAAFWFIGRSSLQPFTVTTASVIVDDGLQTSAATALVVQIERGGTHELELPDGWQPNPAASGVGVEPGVSRTLDDGTVVYEFELEDLGVGAAEATWIAEPVDVALTVTADGRQVEVTAANESGLDFWAWGIVVDGIASASAEPLPAGASEAVAVRNFGVTSYTYEPVISAAVQRRLFYVDEFDSSDFNVVAGLAGRLQSDLPGVARTGIYFFGFTDDAPADVTINGVRSDTIGTTLMVKRSEITSGTLAALGEARPEILAVAGASVIEQYGDGRVWAYGADEMVFGYVLPAEVAGRRITVDPTGTQLKQVEAFDWSNGAFVTVAWGDDLAGFVSAAGEVVVRARPGETGFFEEGILLSRYALKWEPET